MHCEIKKAVHCSLGKKVFSSRFKTYRFKVQGQGDVLPVALSCSVQSAEEGT